MEGTRRGWERIYGSVVDCIWHRAQPQLNSFDGMGLGVPTWSTTLETPLRITYFATITSLAEIDDMSPEDPSIANDLQAER